MILAFDTSGAHCDACLMDAAATSVLAYAHESMTKGQAERLFPMIEDMLTSNGWTWSDLTQIAVGVGPGNFTGIRIAVSAARGLAMSLGIPASGVSSFEALALGQDAPCRAVVGGGLNTVYWQGFGTEDSAVHMGEREAVPTDLPLLGVMGNLPSHFGHCEALARIAAAGGGTMPPKPLYVRPADAAPPRDTAPVLLD